MAEAKHVTVWHYVGTYLGLLALTALTFGISFAGLGRFEVVVALAIAIAKALLIVFIFMHLSEASFTNRFIALVAALFIVLIVSLTVADVATRRTFPVGPEQANNSGAE